MSWGLFEAASTDLVAFARTTLAREGLMGGRRTGKRAAPAGNARPHGNTVSCEVVPHSVTTVPPRQFSDAPAAAGEHCLHIEPEHRRPGPIHAHALGISRC